MVSGLITCDELHDVHILVSITQGDGMNADGANGDTFGPCLGTSQPWEVRAFTFGGQLHPGKAVAIVQVNTLGPDGGDVVITDAVVRLRS